MTVKSRALTQFSLTNVPATYLCQFAPHLEDVWLDA